MLENAIIMYPNISKNNMLIKLQVLKIWMSWYLLSCNGLVLVMIEIALSLWWASKILMFWFALCCTRGDLLFSYNSLFIYVFLSMKMMMVIEFYLQLMLILLLLPAMLDQQDKRWWFWLVSALWFWSNPFAFELLDFAWKRIVISINYLRSMPLFSLFWLIDVWYSSVTRQSSAWSCFLYRNCHFFSIVWDHSVW